MENVFDSQTCDIKIAPVDGHPILKMTELAE
jgi:hypothetical protein